MLRITSLVLWIACASTNVAESAKSERHVIVVVWDGMRPDFVSKENTPALWKLGHEGVIFRNHHAVYPSATMVNGTALVTGRYPGNSGIIANHEYRPEIERKPPIDIEIPAIVEKGDQLSGGNISFPTIAELVQKAGGRTVIAAAKTVGLLLDRRVAAAPGNVNGSISPLTEGERMEVRGSTTPITERHEPAPCPLPSQGRGEQIRKTTPRSTLNAQRTASRFSWARRSRVTR